MKRLIPIFMLSLFAVTVSAQENPEYLYISLNGGKVEKFSIDEIRSMGFEAIEEIKFPAADNSVALDDYDPATSVKTLLQAAGTECTDTLGGKKITQEEYDEIKVFTTELVKGLNTQKEIHDKCFNWIRENVKYGSYNEDGTVVNNDPYPMFKNKRGVCQGYANLLFVMLHTQNVPVMTVNGRLQGIGHAWNYVCCDGIWYVSDPTNGWSFVYKMTDVSEYQYVLMPDYLDVVLFKENDCWLNFYNDRFNICQVVCEDDVFVTPYSVGGVKVTSFNPTYVAPNVREIYIGKNINFFVDSNLGHINGLQAYAPNLEYISVDPENTTFVSHKGAVYNKEDNTIAVVPSGIKKLELLLIKKVGKETVRNLNGVEEIRFAEGTETIENYAVENCPKLKVVYVPSGATVKSSAFPSSVEIVRY